MNKLTYNLSDLKKDITTAIYPPEDMCYGTAPVNESLSKLLKERHEAMLKRVIKLFDKYKNNG